MDGHGAALGGAIVDSGKFDWMAHADKYPGLCTPDESYHGITYAEKFGKEGAFITKCTAQLMRDFGSMQSPQNAFILNLGLESLHVRMPKHVENGQAVAEFLEAHPKVAYVNYSGLPSDKYYEREDIITKTIAHNGFINVDTYIRNADGGLVSENEEDGRRYILKNWVDARECNVNDISDIAAGVSTLARLHTSLDEAAVCFREMDVNPVAGLRIIMCAI